MIGLRFRSVGWVAAVAIAALGCYVATQRVAGERRQLAAVERDILRGHRDVRQMEVEIETRGRMSQLERWNSDVLALSAPNPRQFLHGEVQLASLNDAAPLPVDPAAAPPASVRTVAYAKPEPRAAASAPEVAASPAAPEPLLRHATFIRPHDDRLAPKATTVALESAGFAADLAALAASEAKSRRR